MYTNALMLNGKYDEAIALCKSHKSVGWTSEDNPKHMVLHFLLVLLSEGTNTIACDGQWQRSVGFGYLTDAESLTARYQRLVSLTKERFPLTPQREEAYISWCKREIGRRVAHIVSNQFRNSYFKAARLIAAMSETFLTRGIRKRP